VCAPSTSSSVPPIRDVTGVRGDATTRLLEQFEPRM
jgi:hypothetical protein